MTRNGNWLIIKAAEQKKSLLRWFGLEPWEYLNEGGNWIQRGEEKFYLKGAYVTPTGWKVALDWEQPPEILISPGAGGQAGIIPCFACGLAPRLYKNWHQAWVLLKCKSCDRKRYCVSRRREAQCSKCLPRTPRFYSWERTHQEIEVVKLVCGRKKIDSRNLGCVGERLGGNYNKL